MSHVIFDTLAFVKKLKQSGFADNQAEALSEAFKEAQKTAIDDLATKSDFKELKSDIQELRQELKSDIKELRLETEGQFTLIKWMIGFVLAGILAIGTKILIN